MIITNNFLVLWACSALFFWTRQSLAVVDTPFDFLHKKIFVRIWPLPNSFCERLTITRLAYARFGYLVCAGKLAARVLVYMPLRVHTYVGAQNCST